MKQNHKSTINACYCAYIVQAIINNFAPLLFVKFQNEFSVPLSQITLLITFNFSVQLLVDLLSTKVLEKIGYRASMIAAHFLSSLGMISLAVLPFVMSNHFVGLLLSVMISAIGGGILEVLVSPIVEACPWRRFGLFIRSKRCRLCIIGIQQQPKDRHTVCNGIPRNPPHQHPPAKQARQIKMQYIKKTSWPKSWSRGF